MATSPKPKVAEAKAVFRAMAGTQCVHHVRGRLCENTAANTVYVSKDGKLVLQVALCSLHLRHLTRMTKGNIDGQTVLDKYANQS